MKQYKVWLREGDEMLEIVHHPGFDSDLVIDGRVVAKLAPHVADEVEGEIERLRDALVPFAERWVHPENPDFYNRRAAEVLGC